MNCSNCGNELERVINDGRGRRSTDYPQYEDALIIDLNGGYGMYFDDLFTSTSRSIFCRSCADELIKAFPVLKPLEQGLINGE